LKEKFQGQVVASESFEKGAADLRMQLTKIKNSGADAIYSIDNYPGSAIAALKQIKELGISAAIFGSDGLKNQGIIEGAENTAEGLILTSLNSGTAVFIAEYIRIYEKEPGQFAAQGHDAFKTIAIAIRDGAKTGEEIKNRLYGIEFWGASGKIIFDANGDINGNYEVLQVVQGKFVPLVI
jgi:branched-chain amino acid transport system substrate-binding protein